MSEARVIRNTSETARHPWPDDCMIQGGDRGVVIAGDGSARRTAFFEAFPENPGTFLRGEGAIIADAEDACWRQYEIYVACPHAGPFDRRHYRNGAAYCTQCGTWFPKVFGELPPDPSRPKPLVERVFGDCDPAALLEVLTTMAMVDHLPPAHEDK